jgi:CheY-like chemotaxis protein
MYSRIDVLIVDDSDADAEETLQAVKTALDHPEIVRLRDGETAAHFLFRTGLYKDRPAITPALILMSLHIPRLHGLQLLERLRREPATRDIRVVVVAPNLNPVAMQSAYSLGARAYVARSDDPEEYAAEIAKVVGRCLAPKPQRGGRPHTRASVSGASPAMPS